METTRLHPLDPGGRETEIEAARQDGDPDPADANPFLLMDASAPTLQAFLEATQTAEVDRPVVVTQAAQMGAGE
eukprot:12253586-Alexandrium_andersonii.AAC.1